MIAAVAVVCLGTAVSAQEKMTPTVWIDPDGCEHWVLDDGAEGYMSPHLRPDGTPVCRTQNLCSVLQTDLLFGFDSAAINRAGRDRLAKALRDAPARAYAIHGHTDNQGSRAYNRSLSQRRAEAVASLARSMGAPITDVIAFGEDRPRASNDSEAGRRLNRRVEIQCLK